MQFLSPIWFFALTALAMPVVIHLWNTRRGKTLRVGSIGWMVPGNRQNRRSLQLTELLLLLLRLLLLLLLTLLLTQALWLQKNTAKKSNGWLLIAPGQVQSAYLARKKTIDSLLGSGYELHLFSGEFVKTNLKQALGPQQKNTYKRSMHWDTLRKLGTKIPAGLPVVLITDRRLASFSGRRPHFGTQLRWITFSGPDSVSERPIKSWQRPDARRQTATLISKPSGGYFRFSTDEKTSAKSAHEQPVLHVSVYAGPQNDAQYVQAALEAIRDFSGRRMEISNRPQANTDWLFWLSPKPLPAHIKPKHVFRYASGKTTAKEALFTLPGSTEAVSVYKVFSAGAKGEELWTDATGSSLLNHFEHSWGDEYIFYSRFNPAWNNLVWHPHFAEMLLQLIYPETPIPTQADKREVNEAQVAPSQTGQKTTKRADFTIEKKELTTTLWTLLLIVFCIERFAAHYRKEVAT